MLPHRSTGSVEGLSLSSLIPEYTEHTTGDLKALDKDVCGALSCTHTATADLVNGNILWREDKGDRKIN